MLLILYNAVGAVDFADISCQIVYRSIRGTVSDLRSPVTRFNPFSAAVPTWAQTLGVRPGSFCELERG